MYNLDGRGEMSISEMIICLNAMLSGLLLVRPTNVKMPEIDIIEEMAESAFEEAGVDKDGCISREEWRKVKYSSCCLFVCCFRSLFPKLTHHQLFCGMMVCGG